MAARARARPEASPSAPRVIAAVSLPPPPASATSMPSGAAVTTVSDAVTVHWFFLAPSPCENPALLGHI